MQDKAYPGTKVCHYYTTQWQKMGYNVRVVHFITLFPRVYYLLGKLFGKLIEAKTGAVVYNKVPRKYKKYTLDNIPILLMPLFKIIPHNNFKEKVIRKAFDMVCEELEKDNFIPDIITAHFALPQLHILHLLKERYKDVSTCLVMHSEGYSIPKIYPNYKTYFKSVDIWGFRSEAFRNSFKATFGKQSQSFICYSGIPEEFIDEAIEKDFPKGVKSFSFLGSLFKLKRIDDTIIALKNVFGEDDFTFDIIGDGAEKSNIEALINKLELEENVIFHGRLPRNESQKLLANSQCFIMVSSREAFGLVYVEAMAKGCIAIGTRGQGIDGVIKHGENGFLCESSNIEELSSIIREIMSMPIKELNRISNNAIATARNLTDRKVAEHYINSVINSKE